MTAHDWWVISPELAVAGLAILVVLADLVIRDKRLLVGIAVAGLAVPLFFSLNLWFGWFGDVGVNPPPALFGTIVADRFALFFHFLLIGVTAAVALASMKYVERMPNLRGEFLALMLFSVTGMMFLVSAHELVSIYVSLELTALPVAALAAFHKGPRSVEAGLKFLVLSAIASALLLYGMVYIYGFTGSTNLEVIWQRLAEIPSESGQPFGSYGVLLAVVLIVAGFAFKMAVVPWHMWVPDVYEGSPTPLAAFLSVASKASAFAVVMRVLYTAFGHDALVQDWSGFIAVLAAATMTAGNLLALSQTNIKRLLGYSTVAQAGYILVGVAAVAVNSDTAGTIAGPQGALYYLMGYAFTNLAVFIAVIAIYEPDRQRVDHRLQWDGPPIACIGDDAHGRAVIAARRAPDSRFHVEGVRLQRRGQFRPPLAGHTRHDQYRRFCLLLFACGAGHLLRGTAVGHSRPA